MAKTPARRTAPRIAVVDGQPTTTSRDIAETFGKRHDDVLKRIRSLECSPEFTARNFAASEYTDPTGRTLTEYRITRDGFAFLCMGFTGAKAAQWKERYIATFNRMAERLAAKAARPHHVAQPRNMAPALPGPDALRAHMAAGLSPAQPLPPAVAALVDRRAWDLCAEAFPLLRDHIARQVAYRTIPADRAEPTPALHAVLAETTLTTALAGPIRAAEQRAMTFIEIAARCTQQALQEARAAQAGDAA